MFLDFWDRHKLCKYILEADFIYFIFMWFEIWEYENWILLNTLFFFHREIKIKRKKYSNTARNFIKILYINEYSSKTLYIKREGNVISEECYMGFIKLKWSFIMSSCEEKLILMVKVKVHMTHLKKKHVWSWNLSDIFVIRTMLREWVPSTKILQKNLLICQIWLELLQILHFRSTSLNSLQKWTFQNSHLHLWMDSLQSAANLQSASKPYHCLIQALWVKLSRWNCLEAINSFASMNSQIIVTDGLSVLTLFQ